MPTMSFDLQRFSTYGSSRNDTLSHAENSGYVYAYGGNDSIYNSGNRVKIYAGDGDDTVNNYIGDSGTIDGGNGNDNISNNSGYNVSISGGIGNDTITNQTGYWATIDGGIGNDVISLSGSHEHFVTVRGSLGNDTIYGNDATKMLYQYNLGDGNDKLFNWTSSDTISFGKNVYYTRTTVDSDVILSVVNGTGALTLLGAADKQINITNGIAARVTENSTRHSLIGGSVYSDTIKNCAGDVTIQAMSGNDSIYSSTERSYTVKGVYGNVTIDAGDGDDTIHSNDPNVSINGGTGDDLISVYSGSYSGISLRGGKGNDTLYGSGNINSGGILYQFTYGDGSDVIYNWNVHDTLAMGIGCYYDRATVRNDVVITTFFGDKLTLKGASKKKVKIVGGVRYSSVSSSGESISNKTVNTLLGGTNANDTIKNFAGNVTIQAKGGNDSIYSSTEQNHAVSGGYGYVTIDGGDGNDIIHSNDPNVSISGGSGNDSISLSGDNWEGISVNGGKDNDTIYTSIYRQSGIVYQFQPGDGYDVIMNWNDKDTLALNGNTYTQSFSGENVIVSLQSGSAVTLVGAKDKSVNITGGTLISDDRSKFISNYSKNSTLTGSTYSDTIDNYAGGVKIQALEGNDYIFSNTEQSRTVNGNFGHVTIDGGAGRDTIKSYDPNVSINGGAGADVISLQSSGFGNVTVTGGVDNDTIFGDSLGGGILYQYNVGDGYDVIFGYNSKDSISIGGGNDWTTLRSGNNVLVSVAGSGVLTLFNASGKTLNIYSDKSSSLKDDLTPATVTVTEKDVIQKFMKALDRTDSSGVAALNQAVLAATGGYFQNISAAVNQMILDCRAYTAADSSKGWRKFLQEKCGINLYNQDTGAITGFDAGSSSTQKDASAIVPEKGSLNSFTDSSFTVNGLTIQLADFDSNGNPYDISYSSLSNDTQRYIWQALQTWWASSSLNLIAQSYGNNYTFGAESTVNKLYFSFYDEDSNVLAITYNWTSDAARKTITKLAIRLNTHNYDSLIIGNKDGKRANDTFYLDRVLAHEFTHAVMFANVNYVRDLPLYIKEGIAELTVGADDDREISILSLAKNPDKLANALNVDCTDSYTGGYMFLRYLAKQGALHYPASDVSGELLYSLQNKTSETLTSGKSAAVSVNGAVLTLTKDFSDDMLDLGKYVAVKKVDTSEVSRGMMIVGNGNANSIVAGTSNDSIFANVGNDTINGGAGNDVLHGEGGNDKLYGGNGNDSLNGGSGNDTLTSGNGNDVFIFGEGFGKDVITDYTPGKDKIRLAVEDASITSCAVNGKNLVLNVDKTNTITIKNGAGKKITVVDYSGKATTLIRGGNGADTLSGGTGNDKIFGGKGNDSLSGGNGADTLSGSSGNDKIFGGSGNDSLVGGNGADTLSGGDGNDKLFGGNGNDSIHGGKGNDSLWGNAGADTFIYANGDGKDVIYGFDNNDLLKITGTFSASYSKSKGEVYFKVGSTSKAITLHDFTASSFNVNSSTYRISGSKLVKK